MCIVLQNIFIVAISKTWQLCIMSFVVCSRFGCCCCLPLLFSPSISQCSFICRCPHIFYVCVKYSYIFFGCFFFVHSFSVAVIIRAYLVSNFGLVCILSNPIFVLRFCGNFSTLAISLVCFWIENNVEFG